MVEPTDAQRLARELIAGASPAEQRALLDALLSGRVTSLVDRLRLSSMPSLAPIPADTFGVGVRLDLHGAKPPIWRRLVLPGDLTLPRLHDVIQIAMGWSDSHLHRFRTGRDPRAPYFITQFDVDEGEEGMLEDEVRVDQLLRERGDELWYEYDFGDGWEHRLVVEEVLGERPTTVRCLDGRMACPPEDCGGIGGYAELATWVRGGSGELHLPTVFDSVEDAVHWLPVDWHPDSFDVNEANDALEGVLAEPVPVAGEFADLAGAIERRGIRLLREVLGRPSSHGTVEVGDDGAARITATYREFLDAVGDGVKLTSAGYLPPSVVERFARRSGITSWWIGKANREDLTPPVAEVRESARALGLVAVRKGTLSPTAAAVKCGSDPNALLRHIVGRLPLGTKDAERQAGWLALAVVGSEVPAEQWSRDTSDLLYAAGWSSAHDRFSPPRADSPTLRVLELLTGALRSGWRVRGTDPAVAATARAAIRR